MKHHLSSIRRSPWLRVACVLILTLLCAPAAVSAAPVGLPAASGSHLGSAFLAAGLGGMIVLRNAASDDGKDNGGGGDASVDPAAAIAAIEDRTLPISQRPGVALKALKRIAPAEQFTKVKADFAKVAVEAAKGTAKEGELKGPRLPSNNHRCTSSVAVVKPRSLWLARRDFLHTKKPPPGEPGSGVVDEC